MKITYTQRVVDTFGLFLCNQRQCTRAPNMNGSDLLLLLFNITVIEVLLTSVFPFRFIILKYNNDNKGTGQLVAAVEEWRRATLGE